MLLKGEAVQIINEVVESSVKQDMPWRVAQCVVVMLTLTSDDESNIMVTLQWSSSAGESV